MSDFVKKGIANYADDQSAEKKLLAKGYVPHKLTDSDYLAEYHLYEGENLVKIARIQKGESAMIVQYFAPGKPE